MTFSDKPVSRDVVGANAEELATTYANGTITITPDSSSIGELKLSISRPVPTSLNLGLSGLTIGTRYTLETSTNLSTWTSIKMLTATNNAVLLNQTVDKSQTLYFRARTE